MTEHSGVHEKGTFTVQDLLSNAKKNKNFAKAGAIAVFIGVVRGENNEGQKVVKLTMEAYEEKANEVLTAISRELSKKPGIVDVQIHHLLGQFNVGDEVVYVAVSGGHRQEVFAVLQEAVERYKHEVPVFKKETIVNSHGKESGRWVSETGKQKQ
ncbi:MAG TPA: molybdenum cofactor biosynthesis protein MoaE [Candidatus Sulfotelmatobacter sp.]|nr:molybdenum cofactor biosynthesis protein MoaE [Candidatus Sulfotelmatobacter sp.]